MTNKDKLLSPTSCTPEQAQFLRQQAAEMDTSIAHLVRMGLRLLDESSKPNEEGHPEFTSRIPVILLNDGQKVQMDKLLGGQFKTKAQIVRAAVTAYQKSVTITEKESVK